MTLQERIKELHAKIASFNRPPLGVTAENLRARQAWDNADQARCDSYWAATEEHNRLLDQQERAASLEAIDRRATKAVERCGAPERLVALSLSPDETPSVAAVRQWLSGSAPVLTLSGGVGTGKTVASLWGLRRLAYRHATPVYVRAGELARLGAFGDAGARFEETCRAGALVLDDLGTEALGEWGSANLNALVDARYGSLTRRTIITTNLGWDAISARYGERVADRLREGSAFCGTGEGSMRSLNGDPATARRIDSGGGQ